MTSAIRALNPNRPMAEVFSGVSPKEKGVGLETPLEIMEVETKTSLDTAGEPTASTSRQEVCEGSKTRA